MIRPERADLRSKLARVRGLGAAHHGVGHWWLQRVTALALVPLTLWFISQLMSVLLSPNVVAIAEWISYPAHAILLVMMLVALFVHAKLGVQVVIEDYVHGPVLKYVLLLANVFICFAFAAISIMAVLKLHFLDLASNM
jgi:succinate dehydrogenase / fumarate reductase membrane anchor subunit